MWAKDENIYSIFQQQKTLLFKYTWNILEINHMLENHKIQKANIAQK